MKTLFRRMIKTVILSIVILLGAGCTDPLIANAEDYTEVSDYSGLSSQLGSYNVPLREARQRRS